MLPVPSKLRDLCRRGCGWRMTSRNRYNKGDVHMELKKTVIAYTRSAQTQARQNPAKRLTAINSC